MPKFKYTILHDGARNSGVLEAASHTAAAAQLRRDGCLILELKQDNSNAKSDAASTDRPTVGRALDYLFITKAQTEITLRQLSSLLGARGADYHRVSGGRTTGPANAFPGIQPHFGKDSSGLFPATMPDGRSALY